MNEHFSDDISTNQEQNTTTLFYFTGTGNSLWAARTLASKLGQTDVISMINFPAEQRTVNSRVIGLIFPVHVWGVPRRVLEFLQMLKGMSADYIFAVATNGGQVSNTMVQLKKEMEVMGLTLNAGWSVEMPSNYIPWGGPGSQDEQKQLFQAASLKISHIANKVTKKSNMPVEKGPLWQRIIFTGIYKITLPHIPKMDKSFWVDERCDQCSLCVKVCPVQNLKMDNHKLVWQNQCDQCLACLQWCPKQALQYGKKTSAYERYHHPEIKFKDMLR